LYDNENPYKLIYIDTFVLKTKLTKQPRFHW